MRAGMQVVAVVGVAGSPSCGATGDATFRASSRAGRVVPGPDRPGFNEPDHLCGGRSRRGHVCEALADTLRRRHLDVPFTEHDLLAELHAE